MQKSYVEHPFENLSVCGKVVSECVTFMPLWLLIRG